MNNYEFITILNFHLIILIIYLILFIDNPYVFFNPMIILIYLSIL
jgi:hypothetical protein